MPRPDAARNGGRARLVSVAVVVLAACGLDVIAEEPPVHLLQIGLVAGVVGVFRLALRGRFRHLFVLLNVTVLAQPAAYAASTLAHVGAEQLPHSEVVPDGVWAPALQLVITLLVVVVAGSEPLLGFVGAGPRIGVRSFLLGGVAPAADQPCPTRLAARPAVSDPVEVLLARRRPRRGPPVLAAIPA